MNGWSHNVTRVIATTLEGIQIMGRSYVDIQNPERNRGKGRNELKLISLPTPVKGLQQGVQEMNTKTNERYKIANKSP
jgi:hypothetical protein